jgi:hypothetical protein
MDLGGFVGTTAASLTASAAMSVIISSAIGAFTFVAGMRIGKNNADRATLRTQYLTLFEHFTAIQRRIGDGDPKGWTDFKLVSERYTPLAHEMIIDGRAALLPEVIRDAAKRVEDEALRSGTIFRAVVTDQFVPAVRDLVGGSVLTPSSSISGRPYRPWSVLQIAYDPTAFTSAEVREDIGLAVDIATERSRSAMLYIYPERMFEDATPEKVIHSIAMLADEPAIAEARRRLRDASDEVRQLLSELSARIKDPHPLYETLRATLDEIFRRGR